MPRTALIAALSLLLAALPRSVSAQDEQDTEGGPELMGADYRPSPPAPIRDLPPEARKIADVFDKGVAEAHKTAEDKIDALRAKTVKLLKPLQDQYSRDAKLDEAVAIREQIRRIQGIRPDPGTLRARPGDEGRTWYFEVVGSSKGTIWGTDVYTTDSALAVAAVHAGVLKPGEKGVVKVTLLPGRDSYKGTSRNDVTSVSYGKWGMSFSVEKLSP